MISLTTTYRYFVDVDSIDIGPNDDPCDPIYYRENLAGHLEMLWPYYGNGYQWHDSVVDRAYLRPVGPTEFLAHTAR